MQCSQLLNDLVHDNFHNSTIESDDDDDNDEKNKSQMSVNCLSKMVNHIQFWTKLGIIWIHLRLELLFNEQQATVLITHIIVFCLERLSCRVAWWGF